MNKLIITCTFVLATVTGLVLTSCKKQLKDLSGYKALDDTKKDTLRIYNLLPDISGDGNATGYLVYVNDSLIRYQGTSAQYAVTYGAIPYVILPATGGTFNIKLAAYSYTNDTPAVKTPPDSRIVIQKTIDVPPHSGYGDMVFYDDNGKPAVKYIPVTSADPGAPAPGKFKIRVINFSYAMDDSYAPPENSAGQKNSISLRYADSTDLPGISNVPFASVSDYAEVEYGTQQFWVYNNTDQVYLHNSGVMDDAIKTFDLYPVSIDPTNPYNRIFPSVRPASPYDQSASLQVSNVGSYPFAAGYCYSILVIGNIYAVLTDRRYGAGDLDNCGKVQVVNTNAHQQKVDVKITYPGGEKDFPALAFGAYTQPLTVPAGEVKVTFGGGDGQTPYSYTSEVTRLSNFTWYYNSDLNNLPFVLPISNVITSDDYKPGDWSNPAVIMFSKVGMMNLVPDAGKIFLTHFPYLFPTQEINMSSEVGYKSRISATTYDGTQPPAKILARLSTSRTDTLAARQVASMTKIFPTFPAPGTYTLVAAGLLNTTDTAKSIHLFMIKHTNFISKGK
ncbi:MAG: DUF4397 domain-containing protein [Chitinophagaceae bacterium]|nr:DUF4397 domain-containing protein [Chitinophagaceae bacterium]